MSSIPKVAILTGSAGGIGQEITSMLARQGWNLGLVNRSPQKTKSQLEALRPMYPDQEFAGFTANLIDMSEVKRIAEEISLKFPKISALYNIAGLLTDKRVMSPQDIEGHFAVNTLAPYYLTQLLRQQLGEGARASRHSVVVNFASSAMNGVKELDVETLANPESIGGLTGAYAKSKAALAAASLANRKELLKDDIFIQVVDPGPTKTTMTRSSDGMPWFLRLLYPLIFKPADLQAQKLVTGVELAVHEGKSGLYIAEGRRKPYPSIALNKGIQSEVKLLLDTEIQQVEQLSKCTDDI